MTHPYKGFHLDPEFEAMPKISVTDAHALIDEYRAESRIDRDHATLETLGRAGWHEKKNPRPTPTRRRWSTILAEALCPLENFGQLYHVAVLHDTPRTHGHDRTQPVVTVCVLTEQYGHRSFIGVARCAAGDQFSRRKGRELALARAMAKIKT